MIASDPPVEQAAEAEPTAGAAETAEDVGEAPFADEEAPAIGFPASDDSVDGAEADDADGDEVWNDGSLDKAGYDPTLSSSEPCLDNESDPVAGIVYTVAHHVVDGVLGEACFGSEDNTLLDAWFILSDITPPDQLRDLTIFAGFESDGDGAEASTLAFVAPVDDNGSQFQMAVNLPSSRDDWDEASLTIAHEFSHVFTAVPSELDRFASEDDCSTYDNLEGCYLPDSIMAGWYQTFWPEFGYDPSGGQEADEIDGEARCDASPGFFGSYGASNPEEDFAESFAAYVMRVDALTDAQQDKLDWIDQFEGLREFRDRAQATGYGPYANNFGECGLG